MILPLAGGPCHGASPHAGRGRPAPCCFSTRPRNAFPSDTTSEGPLRTAPPTQVRGAWVF